MSVKFRDQIIAGGCAGGNGVELKNMVLNLTTNSNGNANSNLSWHDYEIVSVTQASVLSTSSAYTDIYVIPYKEMIEVEPVWWFRTKNWDDTKISNKDISYLITYYERNNT